MPAMKLTGERLSVPGKPRRTLGAGARHDAYLQAVQLAEARLARRPARSSSGLVHWQDSAGQTGQVREGHTVRHTTEGWEQVAVTGFDNPGRNGKVDVGPIIVSVDGATRHAGISQFVLLRRIPEIHTMPWQGDPPQSIDIATDLTPAKRGDRKHLTEVLQITPREMAASALADVIDGYDREWGTLQSDGSKRFEGTFRRFGGITVSGTVNRMQSSTYRELFADLPNGQIIGLSLTEELGKPPDLQFCTEGPGGTVAMQATPPSQIYVNDIGKLWSQVRLQPLLLPRGRKR